MDGIHYCKPTKGSTLTSLHKQYSFFKALHKDSTFPTLLAHSKAAKLIGTKHFWNTYVHREKSRSMVIKCKYSYQSQPKVPRRLIIFPFEVL